jgi:hypothetical protein
MLVISNVVVMYKNAFRHVSTEVENTTLFEHIWMCTETIVQCTVKLP